MLKMKSMYTIEGDGIGIAEMRTVFVYVNTRVFCMLCVVCFTARRAHLIPALHFLCDVPCTCPSFPVRRAVTSHRK